VLLLTRAAAAEFSYRDSQRVSNPKLFNFGSNSSGSLDNYKVIDLSANVQVGASCGEMNVATNLQSNLNDLLGDDFFKGVGNKIQSAGGMLALCYLSPSYCAIAKHMRLSSHFLSQLNLDSCSMIDKYIDTRVSDYEISKQQCVRGRMEANGNNVKSALEECSGKADELMDWSGKSSGPVKANALLDSTAKWAGINGEDASHTLAVTKALVGETVVARGGVEVEFGERKKLITPREMINEVGRDNEKILEEILTEIDGNRTSWDNNAETREKVEKVFAGQMSSTTALSTLRKLSHLPFRQRSEAVSRLSKALASHQVVKDAEKSLELLGLAARNPNLPPARQQEAVALREQLKDQLDLTVRMRSQNEDDLGNVIESISSEGDYFEDGVIRRRLESDSSARGRARVSESYFDCSDKAFCLKELN
jgi:hypothetical protein